ncbi:MAG: hypothetical protein E7672_03125 [Ruminococcaceae bacterium]|nr:hypothetical protein [Oscillospiraceae bacterium]
MAEIQKRNIFPRLIGNNNLKNTLSSDLAEGKSAHAYIIEGQKGSGKHTAAREICASVLCENRGDGRYPLPCGECSQCRKILGGFSVDVMTVSNGDKASIGVDAVRDIKNSLYITPNDGDKKFYIIENAHLMTPQAQNALLISLEEPPPYVMFILLCEDSSVLLETIKSRAPVLKTEKFQPDFIEDFLARKYPSANREKIIHSAHLSSGTLGQAIDLYENGGAKLEQYGTASELVRNLLSAKKSEALTFVTQSLPKDRSSVKQILSLTKLALRDIISEKKGGDLLFYSKSEGTPKFAKNLSVKKLIEISADISSAEEKISANCSQSTVMISLVMNI